MWVCEISLGGGVDLLFGYQFKREHQPETVHFQDSLTICEPTGEQPRADVDVSNNSNISEDERRKEKAYGPQALGRGFYVTPPNKAAVGETYAVWLQNRYPQLESWKMETWTQTCGFLGSILTQFGMKHHFHGPLQVPSWWFKAAFETDMGTASETGTEDGHVAFGCMCALMRLQCVGPTFEPPFKLESVRARPLVPADPYMNHLSPEDPSRFLHGTC